MTASKKDQIRELLKSIETGEPGPIAVVNEAKYIQHNPQTQEGSEGLAALFKRLSKTSPRVNIVRAFEDGDFVFAHTEYDFASRKIGFEVFRFEDGRAVEHWDNIQARQGPSQSGRSMVDGPTAERSDLDQTETNRAVVRSFVETVLIARATRTGSPITSPTAPTRSTIRDSPMMRRTLLRSALDAPHDGEQTRRLPADLHRGLGRGQLRALPKRGQLRRSPFRFLRSLSRR